MDPNKPKKPASSFFRFSREERKKLVEERPGINNSTINALISLKWKVYNAHFSSKVESTPSQLRVNVKGNLRATTKLSPWF